jgi:hypothetical protein
MHCASSAPILPIVRLYCLMSAAHQFGRASPRARFFIGRKRRGHISRDPHFCGRWETRAFGIFRLKARIAMARGSTCQPLARPLTFGRRSGRLDRALSNIVAALTIGVGMRGTCLRIGHCRLGRITKEVTMRITSVAAIALVLVTSGALAQNPPADDVPNNKAINSKNENNPGAPVAGANSFTEGQAKSRIESKGFSNVSGLKKDDKGVWRGTAMRDGKSVDVSLDFEGNVVAR